MTSRFPDTTRQQSSDAEIAACRGLAASWTPVLRALAHEERLLIALWLAESECSVRELEQVTGLAQSLVSYHLRELREAGLVASSVQGRSNRYRLADAQLDQLAALLSRLEPGAPAA
jgi:ArsR family transcriptional regulator, arsenate/arsenite/antimonite-responsive transcriptional repressor